MDFAIDDIGFTKCCFADKTLGQNLAEVLGDDTAVICLFDRVFSGKSD